MIEALSATPAATERYEDALQRFVELTSARVPQDDQLPETIEETLVGGVAWIVYQQIRRDEAEQAEDLLPELSEFMLAPYHGAGEAGEPEPGKRRSARALADSSAAVERLPRGRHGLPREFVAQNQRERLLAALAECLRGEGYEGTTVSTIGKRAGVSKSDFYKHFESKDACFVAAYDDAVERIRERGARRLRRAQTDWAAGVLRRARRAARPARRRAGAGAAGAGRGTARRPRRLRPLPGRAAELRPLPARRAPGAGGRRAAAGGDRRGGRRRHRLAARPPRARRRDRAAATSSCRRLRSLR